ncbi:hypothetical protein A2774_05730 [Candidatus Roizmanbacteria bacterium RIFCSPHIGHO2_01_FULL_39_12c]|uniref:Uncharacterized protein n=1 Tax=Candidatus Roizmanbacteria bacterium RIFCSPHIGHO2_01_FULL_39_12c TaxID=1802031 RepID=A0A1F7G8J3_9BACT|nr:MAG: hypothetical protein A2774_05730 [Candidatus Roizmanbacteria bacterium RIFCSPHIGHO2_01_FULL_39_12c]OGK47701.1 MAG: hypothetical protein A2963_00390 [Candidatus Roizmanbacteria bacterium RIFCSPLOWO2_01_FULL_40_13]
MAEEKKLDIAVNTGTHIGSRYAQIVGITVSDDDTITLDFVFVHPREKNKGEVVSRVTVPRRVGEELAKLIQITVKAHDQKKKGVQHD